MCITPGGRFSLQLMQGSCQLARLVQAIEFPTLSKDRAAQRDGVAGSFGQFHQIVAET
jgi:hypothetical protein